MLSWFMSPLGKIAGVIVLAVSLMGAARLWLYDHDQGVVAAVSAEVARTTAASVARQHAAIEAALQTRITEAASQAAAIQSTRSAIDHATSTRACIRAAPIGAALDSLRKSPGGR